MLAAVVLGDPWLRDILPRQLINSRFTTKQINLC